jgi:hypothetical protein
MHRSFASFILLSTLFLTHPAVVTAQEGAAEPRPHSAVYAELLGQGLLYSLNYEYLLSNHVSLRAGFTSWSLPTFPFLPGNMTFTGFPLMVNYLAGEGSNHLELGVGIIPGTVSFTGEETFFGSNISGSKTVVIGTGTFGYRLQPPEGGFIFRIGLVPLIGSGGARVSIGLSTGWAF